jgi:hypothetical protein
LGLGGSSGNSGSTNSQSSSLTNSLAILLPYPDSAVLKGSLSPRHAESDTQWCTLGEQPYEQAE